MEVYTWRFGNDAKMSVMLSCFLRFSFCDVEENSGRMTGVKGVYEE